MLCCWLLCYDAFPEILAQFAKLSIGIFYFQSGDHVLKLLCVFVDHSDSTQRDRPAFKIW